LTRANKAPKLKSKEASIHNMGVLEKSWIMLTVMFS